MERYTEISRSDEQLWSAGCPVLPERWCIWRDNVTGEATGQVQILSLVLSRVTGCTVWLDCFGADGEALEGRSYTLEGTGLRFGMETPLPLPDENTVTLVPKVLSVSYADGGIWGLESDDPSLYPRPQPLPQPEPLESYLPQPELLKEYRDTVGRPCYNAPANFGKLFRCVCGGLTLGHQCRDCGRTFRDVTDPLDPDFLRRRILERREAAAAEAEAKHQAEEKQERRRTSRKLFFGALAAVLILGSLCILTPTVILPRIRNEQAYDKATAALQDHRFGDAQAGFLSLGDFKDSAEMALETRYQEACYLREKGKYADSISIFEELDGYRDADDQAEATLEAWHEADYQAARALVDAGAYPAAAAAFEALGDYKDSANWVVECQMLQREYDYNEALTVMASEDYPAARELFLALGDYRDSKSLAEECFRAQQALDYTAACEALDARDFVTAIGLLETLGDYEDTARKLLEAHYGLGTQYLKEEKYADAIRELDLCGNYQQTDWNLKQAKMGYCRTHADRSDAKTLKYLKELKAAYFQGAKALYDEVFGWKVELTAFSNDDDGTPQETLSKYGVLYAHFKVTGGEPGAKFTLRVLLTVPGGNRGTVYFEDVSDGYVGYANFWFYDPDRAPTGTMTFQAYDESSRLLCTASVKVTN